MPRARSAASLRAVSSISGVAARLLAAAPSRAEPAGDAPRPRVEVGGFLGLDYFGDDIELGNSWAPEQVPGTSILLGGRAAFYFLPDLWRGSI